jgi:hypothetical protein
MVYKWKAAAQIKGLDPQVCGDRMEYIKKTVGAVTAETVLEDARNINSPLHGGFTWDDNEAAEQHRLNEARYLLRQIVIYEEPKEPEGEPTIIRAFVNVQEENQPDATYVDITTAMSDPKLREQILERAYRELTAWKVRYEEFEEFARVVKAINSVKLK